MNDEGDEKLDSICEALGFCGCGMPNEAIRYMRDVLQYIDDLKQRVWTDKIGHDEWVANGRVLFANDGARYVMFYVVNNLGLTEHGGSVPGWLTDSGIEMLSMLNRYISGV